MNRYWEQLSARFAALPRRERLLLFYWFPCTAAALSGALAGGRLARSTQGWAGETSDGGVHRDVAL